MSEELNAPPTTAQVVADALEAAAFLPDTPPNDIPEGQGGCVVCTHCDNIVAYVSFEDRMMAWDELRAHDLTCDKNPLVIELRELKVASSSAPQEPTAFIVSSGGDYWSEPMCDADDAKGVAAAWKKDGLREPITIHPLYLAAPPAPPLAGEQIVERVVRFMCEREDVAYAELADWPTARREGLEAEARDLIAVVRASLPSSPTAPPEQK